MGSSAARRTLQQPRHALRVRHRQAHVHRRRPVERVQVPPALGQNVIHLRGGQGLRGRNVI